MTVFQLTPIGNLDGINFNSEVHFTDVQKKATYITLVDLLPDDFFYESEGERFYKDLQTHFQFHIPLERLKVVRQEIEEGVHKDEEPIEISELNFLDKSWGSLEEITPFEHELRKIFKTDDEKYTFYKILLIASLFQKSLTHLKIETLFRYRILFGLDQTKCDHISYTIGVQSNDPSYQEVVGKQELDFVFFSALKSVFLDDNRIDKREVQFLESLWEVLKFEGERKNILEGFLIKSKVLDKTKLKLDLNSAMKHSILIFLSKCLADAKFTDDGFEEVIKDLESFHLTRERIEEVLESNRESTKSLEELFHQILVYDKFFSLIEYINIQIKGKKFDEDLITMANSLLSTIEYQHRTDIDVDFLLFCEFMMVNLEHFDKLEPFYQYASDHFFRSAKDLKRFQLLVLGFHSLHIAKKIDLIEAENLKKILDILQIEGIDMTKAKLFLESKELRKSTLRLMFLAELPHMTSSNKKNLSLVNKFVEMFLDMEVAEPIKEFVVRVIASGFASSEGIQLKLRQKSKAIVLEFTKDQRDFFNQIVDDIGVDDSTIRKILYHVALDTGVLFQFNERLIYS